MMEETSGPCEGNQSQEHEDVFSNQFDDARKGTEPQHQVDDG